MLDRILKGLWISHPRLGAPDTMLTLAVLSTLTVLAKFLVAGSSFDVFGHKVVCGNIDATVVAAILTPTLGAYVTRKWKDSPDTKKDA